MLQVLFAAATVWSLTGCGTTRWSDTARTATEQLLISNAIDRAVSELDFEVLRGHDVFFDPSYLRGATDENYLVSSLRQHLLASGVVLRELRTEADFVVEARSGGIGTDRSDLLFGVPSVAVPSVPGMPVPMPSTIPEIPFAKTTNQRAVAKIAVFAYNRNTGRPVLQSGIVPVTSTARNSWFFGAGPFQRGTVYEGTKFAGDQVSVPIIGGRQQKRDAGAQSPVNTGTVYRDGFDGMEATAVETAAAPPSSSTSSPLPGAISATAANAAASLALGQQPRAAASPSSPATTQSPSGAPSSPLSPPVGPVALPPTNGVSPPTPSVPSGTTSTGPISGTSSGMSTTSAPVNGKWLVDLWQLREANAAK
ncbi:MAG: hypothetical protein K2Y37_01785 [Pirellulales bacterium]|nr:hypothetical protein [Pirellulales bacterium]